MINESAKIRIEKMLPHFDGRLKRLYLAAEAEVLGRGGIAEISRFTGLHRNTISTGIKDLNSGEVLTTQDGEYFRTRKEGGGRKSIAENQTGILDALGRLVDGSSYGNPEDPLRWTTKSLRNLADELSAEGFRASYVTVGALLEKTGFSLQSNQKMMQVGKQSPDRDGQFMHINETVKEYINNGNPVISIDCKKKENIGSSKNKGAEYAPKKQPVKVLDHDFPLPELGKAVPYGVYDMIYNEGYVNIGISKDTAQFAVQSIRTWWKEMGRQRFPSAKKLYITADGGGSNGHRCRLWKTEVQTLADELHIPIEVSHFPPGTSKWNKIEHRMFSQISKNWRGRPLESLAVIVNLISSTTTNAGLHIECGVDETEYRSGIKVSDEEMAQINIEKMNFTESGIIQYSLINCISNFLTLP